VPIRRVPRVSDRRTTSRYAAEPRDLIDDVAELLDRRPQAAR
jgi:hypothetical protein